MAGLLHRDYAFVTAVLSKLIKQSRLVAWTAKPFATNRIQTTGDIHSRTAM